jgi:MoaA/NifB/PqqE/SkfB family radical SAM enzyme
MSLVHFQRVIEQLGTLPALQTLYLNGYNEPTLVPEIVEQVSLAATLGTELVFLTNATGLTHRKYEALLQAHPRLTVDIHLSAIDPSDYQLLHGVSLHPHLLPRLHSIAKYGRKLGGDIRMMVMGKGDDRHQKNWDEVQNFFSDTGMQVEMDIVHDRAGALPLPYYQGYQHRKVVGCALDSRYSHWIHVTVSGNWVLCCQDFNEHYVFGNVLKQAVWDIAESAHRRDVISNAMGWTGEDELSICQKCHYAIFDASR